MDTRWAAKATALWTAWEQLTGSPPPNANALHLALAQAQFETQCGDAWPLSCNWGACDLRSLTAAELAEFRAGVLKNGAWLEADGTAHAAHDPTDIGQLHGDSDPNAGGFEVWFAAFPDDTAGAKYFLSIALRNTKACLADPACTPWTYAANLYLACYYGGFHSGSRPCGSRSAPLNAAENANIADYAGALSKLLPEVVAGLVGWTAPGSTLPAPPAPPPPATPHPSALAVRALQTALNACGAASPPLAVDGDLGPLTRAACATLAHG